MRKILFILFSLAILTTQAQQSVTSGEYFWDTDPGVGNGTSFTFMSTGATVSESIEFNTTGLSTGIHLLMVRTLTDSGHYSLYDAFPVNITTAYQSPIEQLEFSWDSMSNVGSGDIEMLSSTGDSDTTEFEIDVPSGMSLADHKLNIRPKSVNNIWGLFEPVPITVCTEYGPLASFSQRKEGVLYEMENTSINATSYIWDFDDGTTDTATHPLHIYDDVGIYNIEMVASNTCGSDTAFATVKTGGISSISPDVAGTGGLLTGVLAGVGFIQDSSRFRLIHSVSGTERYPASRLFINSQTIAFSIDLDSAEIGMYDVEYVVGDTTHFYLDSAFEVEPFKEPELDIWVEGPRIMRSGRFYAHEIVIENKGNVDALMVPVFYQTLDLDNVGQFGIIFEYDNLAEDIDTIQKLREQFIAQGGDSAVADNFVTDIPDYGGGAMKVLSFIVPRLKPGITKYKITVVIFQNDLKVSTNARVMNPLLSSRSADIRLKTDSISTADCMAKAIICTINMASNIGSLVGDKFPAIGCLNDLFTFANSVIEDRWGTSLTELAVNAITGGDASKIDQGGLGKLVSLSQKPINYTSTIMSAIMNCGTALADVAVPGSGTMIKTIGNVAKKGKQFSKSADAQRADKINSIKKIVIEDLNCYNDMLSSCFGVDFGMILSALTSSDPNAKYGPGDFDNNYINPENPLPYTITFENVKTASAAAQEVFIYDTLDVNVYDFSSFKFTSYGWDTLSFTAAIETSENGIYSFTDVVDVTPGHPNYVRIDGEFNTNTGVAYWKFTTLDTNTLLLTNDVFEGFLPPNNDSPEGEGYVSFDIELKPGIAEGTSIENKATIVFDVNAPIQTNTWQNLFDTTAPASSVMAMSATQDDTLLTIDWSGTDNLSGIKEYNIYVNSDGGDFFPLELGLDTTSLQIYVAPGILYGFYSIAIDSAGNIEEHPSVPDATTRVTLGIEEVNSAYHGHWLGDAIPNPATTSTEIPYLINGGEIFEIKVITINGKVMDKISSNELVVMNKSKISFNLSDYAKGIYLYTLTVDGVKMTRKFIVQ